MFGKTEYANPCNMVLPIECCVLYTKEKKDEILLDIALVFEKLNDIIHVL